MDIVYIRGLKIQAIIGIFEWERENRQTVIIDLEMAVEKRTRAIRDDISEALDYKKVSERIAEFVSASDFQLVETLSERIAEVLQKEFGVVWLKLRVGKPDALENAESVGVIIERDKRTNGTNF